MIRSLRTLLEYALWYRGLRMLQVQGSNHPRAERYAGFVHAMLQSNKIPQEAERMRSSIAITRTPCNACKKCPTCSLRPQMGPITSLVDRPNSKLQSDRGCCISSHPPAARAQAAIVDSACESVSVRR